ncbi:MAG: structural protein [Gammaproteobacteria bacterium]|nr:structural protein [Gammaproteobacteria bacterium]
MKNALVVIICLIMVGGIVAYSKWKKMPLGIRNNNPGNLRDNGINWNGRIGNNQGFVVFDTMQNGVRAMTLDITSDYRRGMNTIRKLVTEYAPASENNTTAYVNSVAAKVGLNPDAPIVPLEAYLHDLIDAMIYHENGRTIADYDLYKGVQAAMEYRGMA